MFWFLKRTDCPLPSYLLLLKLDYHQKEGEGKSGIYSQRDKTFFVRTWLYLCRPLFIIFFLDLGKIQASISNHKYITLLVTIELIHLALWVD